MSRVSTSSGPNVVAILQARMGATRLPGKVLRPLLGRPMVARVIERLRAAKTVARIVVATTVLPQDDVLLSVAAEEGVELFRGSSDDVLSRYVGAAAATKADVIVRVTADCPVLDPGVVDEAVSGYLARAEELDYVSNTLERTYPRGLDVEVMPRRVLDRLDQAARSAEEREHVTLHLARHRREYRIAQVRAPADHSDGYWTVDTEEDFRLMEEVYAALYPVRPQFSWLEVLDLFRVRPELREINREPGAANDAKLRALVQDQQASP